MANRGWHRRPAQLRRQHHQRQILPPHQQCLRRENDGRQRQRRNRPRHCAQPEQKRLCLLRPNLADFGKQRTIPVQESGLGQVDCRLARTEPTVESGRQRRQFLLRHVEVGRKHGVLVRHRKQPERTQVAACRRRCRPEQHGCGLAGQLCRLEVAAVGSGSYGRGPGQRRRLAEGVQQQRRQ